MEVQDGSRVAFRSRRRWVGALLMALVLACSIYVVCEHLEEGTEHAKSRHLLESKHHLPGLAKFFAPVSSPIGFRPAPEAGTLTAPAVAHRLPRSTEVVQQEGVGIFGRKSIGGMALARIACTFVQCRTPPAVLVASGDEDRVAEQSDVLMIKFTGTLEDGTIFESRFSEEPVGLVVGGGQIVKGFDDGVRGMRVGEKKKLIVPPDQGYGESNEQMIMTVSKQDLNQPGVELGAQVGIGGGMVAVVSAINADTIVLDANPPMAGKTLIFDVELLEFKNPPLEGLDLVGWNGQKFRVPFVQTNSPASKVFENPKWPAAWPYTPADFRRQDESTDVQFYNEPRFVTHIDNGFIGAIKSFYDLQFSQAPQDGYSVLDICSSWVSHYPAKLRAKRVAITGMNELELKANKQATEYTARDLNIEPKLPYGDSEFDFVTNVVSVDYLNKPQEIFKEMHRVLRPGGVAIMSFSNRCFATKAIAMWVANMNDGPGHCQIVGNYFHFSPEGGWKDIASVDISPIPSRTDPVWVVTAVKA